MDYSDSSTIFTLNNYIIKGFIAQSEEVVSHSLNYITKIETNNLSVEETKDLLTEASDMDVLLEIAFRRTYNKLLKLKEEFGEEEGIEIFTYTKNKFISKVIDKYPAICTYKLLTTIDNFDTTVIATMSSLKEKAGKTFDLH